MAKSTQPATFHELKVTLSDVKPTIWRSVAVPSPYTLAKLHRVIQILLEWQDIHLYRFKLNDVQYEVPVPGIDQGPEILDASRARLDDLMLGPGTKFTYEYDFGDGWEFDIVLIKVRPALAGERYPICLDGAGAGPPEDCGGPGGYMDLVDALKHPKRESSKELLDWAGPQFHPDDFSTANTTRWLKEFGRTGRPWAD